MPMNKPPILSGSVRPVSPLPQISMPAARRVRKRKNKPADDADAEQSRSMSSLMISVLIHAAIIGVAVVWVVSEIFIPAPEPEFTPPVKRVQLPAQIREQALSNAKHDAAAPRPSFSQRMASPAPGPVAVPAMPEVNLKQMLPLDPSELVSDQISGMIGASGYGRGTGRGLGGGGGTGKGTGMAFFDIRDSAKSVVIMIDVSQSMFSRTGDYDRGTRKLLKQGSEQAFDIVRREAINLINGLGPDTRFGIVRWSGSARSWKPELVRATDENKRLAREHIIEQVDANTAPPTGGRPGGTRHDYAIEELLRLAPETAFMLTDGNATRTTGRGGMETIPGSELLEQLATAAKNTGSVSLPRIHTIYYLTGADKKEEEDMLKAIARKTKGKFRKVAAATVADKDKDKKDTKGARDNRNR